MDRTSARVAAAVGGTAVVAIAVITVVAGGDEIGAVLLAGALLVGGYVIRRRARDALIYRPLQGRRPRGPLHASRPDHTEEAP